MQNVGNIEVLQIEEIKTIIIEISSKCIANCPFCSRKGKTRAYGEHQITLKEFKLIPESFIKQLKKIYFGGNFGDFCSNPESLNIVEYIKQINKNIFMEGETNGSSQDETWWKRLGSSFKNDRLIFTLDGLEDTHHLHRRGTIFHTIINNIKAFTHGGGVAYWKFIVFEHNEHQIRDAEALAKSIGCAGFFVMSSRDYNEKYRMPKTIDFEIKRDIYYSYWEKLSDKDMYAMCNPFYNGSIYIAADGTVHPCCLAHCMYITEHNKLFRYIVPLIDKYYSEINFKTRPIQEILKNPYFTETSIKSKTNKYCVIKCNKYKNQIKEELVLYDKHFH